MTNKQTNKANPEERREFLKTCGRMLAIATIPAVVGFTYSNTAKRKYATYFWQIDPDMCIFCGLCETECVLPISAVKCVHAKEVCGYCDLCGGYYRANVRDLNTAAENLMCPTGAIERRFIEEPYFEYNIIEKLCVGCGRCARGCNAFGNGAMYLQIKQELCKNCNECQLEKACPAKAIRRVPMSLAYFLKRSAP
jgi:electron transport complex protein RnfB